VLILGGGDGLALREVLRRREVEDVTLVDIDPEMTRLSHAFPPLGRLNAHAYDDPRVKVVNQDALVWLEKQTGVFDVVLIDFPDPHSFTLGKLYTTLFLPAAAGAPGRPGRGVAVQATSPLATRQSYWCIVRTLEAARFSVRPYQVGVPSFGVWGFALAKKSAFPPPAGELPKGLRFLDAETMAAMFVIPPDVGPVDVRVNRLDNQHLCATTRWNGNGGSEKA